MIPNSKLTLIHPASRRALLLLLCCSGFATISQAQDILAPPPGYSTAPPAAEAQANPMEVFRPFGSSAPSELAPIQWGPFNARPHISYEFLHADGLPSSETSHVSSIVQTLSPGVLFGLGTHWTLDYTPTLTFYSSKLFNNTVDHNVKLQGATSYEDWTLGLSQSYSSSSAPLVETGTQTEQQNYVTDLNASYLLNSRMSLDMALEQAIAEATGFSGSRTWSTLDWLNYQFWPRLDAAVGASFGYSDVDFGPNMVFEGLQARTRWRATDKLSFQVHGGFETREFLSGDAGTLATPVVSGLIQYQPFEVTKISLNFDRTVEASLLPGQVTETTSVTAGIDQRLLGILFLDLSGGYSNVRYITSGFGSETRQDNFVTFDASVNFRFRQRGSAGIFYRYSDNSSSEGIFSLTSNQVGVDLAYRF